MKFFKLRLPAFSFDFSTTPLCAEVSSCSESSWTGLEISYFWAKRINTHFSEYLVCHQHKAQIFRLCTEMWQSGFTLPVFVCPLPGSLGRSFLCSHFWVTKGRDHRTNLGTRAIYPEVFCLCLGNHRNETPVQDYVGWLFPWELEANPWYRSFCPRILQAADPVSRRTLCCQTFPQTAPYWKQGAWWQSWINSTGNLKPLWVKWGESLIGHKRSFHTDFQPVSSKDLMEVLPWTARHVWTLTGHTLWISDFCQSCHEALC